MVGAGDLLKQLSRMVEGTILIRRCWPEIAKNGWIFVGNAASRLLGDRTIVTGRWWFIFAFECHRAHAPQFRV